MKHSALLLVDLQNDFCRGGALAVPNGDAVIQIANKVQAYFDCIVATQDWHPNDHASFASNHPGKTVGDVIEVGGVSQLLWPDHCIQGSKGAKLHPQLNTTRIQKIFFKGVDKTIDSYSAFFDNAHLRATGLGEYLLAHGIKEVYIMGLATDFCVNYSCLDAVQMGFKTYLIADGCRGIGDTSEVLRLLEASGVKLRQSDHLF